MGTNRRINLTCMFLMAGETGAPGGHSHPQVGNIPTEMITKKVDILALKLTTLSPFA